MLIYVDGSWFKDQCKARWSFAVFKNNKPVHVESGGIYGRLLSNVDGELEAAKRAVEYALKRRAKLLVLVSIPHRTSLNAFFDFMAEHKGFDETELSFHPS